MKRLAGIGDKYVRKIWMDVYPPLPEVPSLACLESNSLAV